MDSLKEITQKMQQKSKIFPTSSSDTEEEILCPHGQNVKTLWGGRPDYRDCDLCAKDYDEKEKEAEKRRHKMNGFSDKMRNCSVSIPKRFEEKTLGNYTTKTENQKKILKVCEKFIENFDSAKEKGTSMVFCGKPGTGKTHLGYAIVSALWKKYVAARLIAASDMTSDVKSAYKSEDRAVTPESIIREYARYDLLVIDEVGVQVDSEAEKRIFFDIINKRYENMFPTILISNLEKTELTKFIGERAMDRMKENGGMVFAFDWASSR